jgi:hypothetical protein
MLVAVAAAVAAVISCSSAMAQEVWQAEIDTHALFNTVGALYDLDPQLLEAIASVESNYDPSAVSPKGAQGLMQLMPGTARRFRVSDSFDPIENALGAARFLDHIRTALASTPDLGFHLPELLAAYNAGEEAVVQYHGVPPYPETRQYVRRVLVSYLLGGGSGGLAHRLNRVHSVQSRATHGSVAPVSQRAAAANQPDLLDEIADIQHARAVALGASNHPPAAGSDVAGSK